MEILFKTLCAATKLASIFAAIPCTMLGTAVWLVGLVCPQDRCAKKIVYTSEEKIANTSEKKLLTLLRKKLLTLLRKKLLTLLRQKIVNTSEKELSIFDTT